MKEAELRAAATCAHCQKKIGECGVPLFYRVKIERHFIKNDEVQRKAGLESFLGSVPLAAIMGPDEDMTENVIPEARQITICEACSIKNICVAQLAKYSTAKEQDDKA